jgi:hypothetical protein
VPRRAPLRASCGGRVLDARVLLLPVGAGLEHCLSHVPSPDPLAFFPEFCGSSETVRGRIARNGFLASRKFLFNDAPVAQLDRASAF